MAEGGKFTSNIPGLQDLTDQAIRGVLDDLAIQAEAYTKENIISNDSVDTGFMLNTVHALLTGSDGVPARSQSTTTKAGQQVTRESSDLPGTDMLTSGIGIGANYAIHVELKTPAAGPAADKVKGDVSKIVAKWKLK